MSNTTIKKGLIVLVVVAVTGFGAYAFAHMGAGFGHHEWMNSGENMHQSMYGGPGYGYPGDLSAEEKTAFEKERKDFFETTEGLRRELYSKRLELRSELAKSNPGTGEAISLQKKISDLEAQLDQKHLDHMIKVKKITPNVGRGLMAMDHMGYGNHYPGTCWR